MKSISSPCHSFQVRNMISLITNERIFFILTPSEDEMRLWYTNLSRVIARLNAAGSPEQVSHFILHILHNPAFFINSDKHYFIDTSWHLKN